MTTTHIINANVLDTEQMQIAGERHVTIEGDRIVSVDAGSAPAGADRTIDAKGRFLLPGFIDGHVHHVVTTMNFSRLMRLSATELALGMGRLAEATVRRGFTTVRDTGGDTRGLVQAIETGLCAGPRIVRAGRSISQTGGHGDFNPNTNITCACQIFSNSLSHIADGPDAVRHAARHELRDGSAFIKIMASGGVASPTDPFDAIQYTPEEIRAVTVETDHRHTYTTAHAYQPEAIMPAIENGVRCIEHGNLIDANTASRMAELGVTLVPTLVTYHAMSEIGVDMGLPRINVDKNAGVFDKGRESIGIAKNAGLELGFGTDLLGEAQPWQNREFAIRSELEPGSDVLRSMYQVNARLCHLEGEIGVVKAGASADLLLARTDPFENLSDFAEPDKTLDMIMCRGDVIVDRLG